MMIIRRSNSLRPNSLRVVGLALVSSALLAGTAAPLAGQDGAEEARLRKIEAEVRALQRKVFPGGDGRLFEPQIAPGTQPPATSTAANASTSTAVTDMLVRLDALELQLQALTAKSEEHGNTLALLESRLAALETGSGAPLVLPTGAAPNLPAATPAPTPALTASSTPAPTPAPTPTPAPAATLPAATPAAATTTARPGATTATTPAATTAATPAARTVTPAASTPPAASTTAPSAARIAAVQAIAKPQTADAGDDEYSYGFRLWNAGFFPEARQQLTRFVEQYPRHARISYGRNLLGRAFLDDAMPEEAARWFLRNYQADRNAERAPDSLLNLGKAMIALKDTRRACIALAEFGETYPAVASGRLASDYQTARGQVTCQ